MRLLFFNVVSIIRVCFNELMWSILKLKKQLEGRALLSIDLLVKYMACLPGISTNKCQNR